MKNKDEIIAFFTSDIVREAQKPVSQAGYKEGYLTKRGKNFGGWKSRYFVLQGPSLEYYESVSTPVSDSSFRQRHLLRRCGSCVSRSRSQKVSLSARYGSGY